MSDCVCVCGGGGGREGCGGNQMTLSSCQFRLHVLCIGLGEGLQWHYQPVNVKASSTSKGGGGGGER